MCLLPAVQPGAGLAEMGYLAEICNDCFGHLLIAFSDGFHQVRKATARRTSARGTKGEGAEVTEQLKLAVAYCFALLDFASARNFAANGRGSPGVSISGIPSVLVRHESWQGMASEAVSADRGQQVLDAEFSAEKYDTLESSLLGARILMLE